MRFASFAVVLVLALSVCALAVTPSNVMPEKNNVVQGVNIPDGRVGGEDIATATVVPAIPFTDAGNTCVFIDDYDEVCPYTGSTAPDCVYAFTPATDVLVDFFLCMSSYDTKIFVYENVYTPGAPFACVDDAAACGDFNTYMYQSWITDAQLIGGNTYYVVIDGYSGACGDYILDIYEVEECIVECPPDAMLEGEVDCYDEYEDLFNSGCNGPEVYSVVDCPPTDETLVICGTTGVHAYAGLTYRDTDWYMLTLDTPKTITIGAESEAGLLLGFVDMSGGCATAGFYSSVTAAKCTYTTLSYTLPAGQSVVFVSTDAWDPGYVCGSDYYLTIDGYGCTSPVEEKTWGSIKSLYR